MFELIILAIIALLAGIGWMIGKWLQPGIKDNIAILGTQGAGKTTLWYAIIKSDKKFGATIIPEKIPETTVTINGIKRKIGQSIDIPGANTVVEREYQNLVTEKEYIIFIFDAKKILEREEELKDVKKRLVVINDYMNESKKIQLIGSHIDELTNDSKEREKINVKIAEKLGRDFLKKLNNCKDKSINLINLTNKGEVDYYINNVLFKKES